MHNTTPHRPDWFRVYALPIAGLLSIASGCAPLTTRLQVVDYRAGGASTGYVQSFGECYFRFDAVGRLDIVARHAPGPGDAASTEQIVHIRAFWISRPGQTEAETTMINATVSYMIAGAPEGATFEGSGFVSFRLDRNREHLRADLELSSLLPVRRLGQADRLFERAELSGSLAARRDDARVVTLVNECRRRFGPMPDYRPPQGLPEPR